MTTLPNMGIVLPTLGGDSGTWDDKINTGFGLIDAHDHTSGKGAQVPVAGLNINADFAMSGYAVTGLGSIAFNAVTALASGSKRLFVSSSDNELYWRTNAGTNVKLTSGTSINTTLVGGIVGDYSSVGAEVAFDDANDRYTFKQQGSPKVWAVMASGALQIYETGTSESVYVGFKAPAALASSYDITWPAALPAATSLMQISAAGVVTFSNTPPTLDGFAVTSGQSITLAGVGQIKHGTWKVGRLAVVAAITGGSVSYGATGSGSVSPCIMAASTTVWHDITDLLDVGESLTSAVLLTEELTGTANSTFDLIWNRPGSGTFNTSLLSAATTSRDTLPTPVTLTPAAAYTMAAGDSVYITVQTAAASTRANHSIYVNKTRA